MSHQEYYHYQARARGIYGPESVMQQAAALSYRYEQMIGAWLPPDRSVRMVDLACGHGSFLAWLREKNYTSIAGVDFSEEQVALARSVGLEVERAEVISWLESQPQESCAALFAIDFIEHISKDDVMRFLTAARAALKAEGSLILRYPNGDSPFVGLNLFNDVTHVWTYTTNCLQSLALMNGFARCRFADESIAAIRDHRWLKVPLGKLAQRIAGGLLRAAGREEIKYWNSSIWACLQR